MNLILGAKHSSHEPSLLNDWLIGIGSSLALFDFFGLFLVMLFQRLLLGPLFFPLGIAAKFATDAQE